ncbi:hypothetical protein HYX18_00730 [Candidatus Woesearchaeota archaeon]|nr:hypothetical protein [Candidatus Woesearchaeota archaeon]
MENSIASLNREIKELKNQLISLNKEKENWFSKKEAIHKEISSLISEIKKIKSAKSFLEANEEKNRGERDKHNKVVKDLIAKIKELNNKKLDFLKNTKINGDPERIMKLIASLEQKIEIEAIPFDKEKNIMEKINALKKQYSNFSEFKKIIDEHNKISANIMEYKEKANEHHSMLKKAQTENKDNNYHILEISKKIIKLGKDKDVAFKNFIDYKGSFKNTNDKLKEKLMNLNELKNNEYRKKQEILNKKEQKIKTILDKKIKTIEEKIKNKQKLTTEDLIVYQKSSS